MKKKDKELPFAGNENVKSFFFKFETTIGSDLDDEKRASEVPRHLEGVAEEYFEQELSEDYELTEAGKSHQNIKRKFKERLIATAKPKLGESPLGAAIAFKRGGGRIQALLELAERAYSAAKLSEDNKYQLLKRALVNTPFPAEALISARPNDCEGLKKVIVEVHKADREFNPSSTLSGRRASFGAPISAPAEGMASGADLRAAADPRVDDLGPKVEDITREMPRLALLAQKQGSAPPRAKCSICGKFGHDARACNQRIMWSPRHNPDRGAVCSYCKAKGHKMGNCHRKVVDDRRRESAGAAPHPKGLLGGSPGASSNPRNSNTEPRAITPRPGSNSVGYINEDDSVEGSTTTDAEDQTKSAGVFAIMRSRDGEPLLKQTDLRDNTAGASE